MLDAELLARPLDLERSCGVARLVLVVGRVGRVGVRGGALQATLRLGIPVHLVPLSRLAPAPLLDRQRRRPDRDPIQRRVRGYALSRGFHRQRHLDHLVHQPALLIPRPTDEASERVPTLRQQIQVLEAVHVDADREFAPHAEVHPRWGRLYQRRRHRDRTPSTLSTLAPKGRLHFDERIVRVVALGTPSKEAPEKWIDEGSRRGSTENHSVPVRCFLN